MEPREIRTPSRLLWLVSEGVTHSSRTARRGPVPDYDAVSPTVMSFRLPRGSAQVKAKLSDEET